MPEQRLVQPNPPEASNIPADAVADLVVELHYKNTLSADELNTIQLYRRTGDFLSTSMLFLRSNTPRARAH
ncbi:hypothetical protein M422DRAFT_31695 [Sphaerobolus stellatus SS14]|uniref:Uncharacterized protein n=1 Tax=Sphaerobolus stellatus (strain SS14) TaxID=990650 RepID=A0A0C9VIW2_SPHS4|nr:hypothetical protein M422DRAFT_31695 [Sphaerobolus stellatus SS14]